MASSFPLYIAAVQIVTVLPKNTGSATTVKSNCHSARNKETLWQIDLQQHDAIIYSLFSCNVNTRSHIVNCQQFFVN